MKPEASLTFLRDKEWQVVSGEVCLVTEFVPLATMENGQVRALDSTTPYASVRLRCPRLKGEATGFIAHKTDFAMLWAAFNERNSVEGTRATFGVADLPYNDHGVGNNEEVWLVWANDRYKTGMGLLKMILPRLTVMVSPKGGYELLTDKSLRPELTGVARFRAEAPLITWTPLVVAE